MHARMADCNDKPAATRLRGRAAGRAHRTVSDYVILVTV